MRKAAVSALMITLLGLLFGCGGREVSIAERLKETYGMPGTVQMEAAVSCSYEGFAKTYTMSCTGAEDGNYTVTVLAPDYLAGVSAVFDGEKQSLSYGELCLDAGTLSREKISPAAVLPRVMEALGEGYVLEERRETRDGEERLFVTLDTTGQAGKILYAFWLEEESCAPVYAEISVDDEIIFSVEFTNFQFDAILEAQE